MERRALFFLLLPFLSHTAQSAMPEKDYLEALQLAQKKAVRAQVSRSRSENLSSSLLKSLYGKYYEVGDSWNVAAWQLKPTSPMGKAEDPNLNGKQLGPGGIFHYEVISVKNGINPEFTLKITEVSTPDFPRIDPKIESINLRVSNELAVKMKTNTLSEGYKEPSFSSTHLPMGSSFLNLFPLEVPELSSADRKAASALPVLPAKIQEYVKKVAFAPKLDQSIWMEQDDFFGRPIEMIWQQGSPWPSYLKTVNGIAILVPKDSL